jgi:hypothetical protein
VRRNEKGMYAPDPVQTEIVKDSLAYFEKCLRA